ncbi:NAD(+) synthase [Euzebya sp.]|uniref:NAD(+) synthase n=1 Tax=Euzebya sp. TaxID=1971409 RepID=UPI0035148C98
MPGPEAFGSIHGHGMLRVAAATPRATVGDPAVNADTTIELAERADAEGADLVVFPELNLSSYAIDDLHTQEGMRVAVDAALRRVVTATEGLHPLLLIGVPLLRGDRLYNCAVAVHRGDVLGVVPKSFLPNYREYYEKRWFSPGAGIVGAEITAAGRTVPFGTDLLFAATDHPDAVIAVDVCEDYWAPIPPSTHAALAGALVIANLSASNIVVGKARDRALLCASHSLRTASAYIFSAAGPGESTTDLAWDGQSLVFELGEQVAASERFADSAALLVSDVDLARVRLERTRTGTFGDAARAAGSPEARFRRIGFALEPRSDDTGLRRDIPRFPYVPSDPERLDEDCYEAFNIQVDGLTRRMTATGEPKLVIGVSGGIDSTHALIVAAKAMDRLGRPRSDILGITMPGFATGDTTKSNAWRLMEAMGVSAEEIDIRPAAEQMLADLDHPFSRGEEVYDVTFENVQAGLRTDYLFRIANHRGGFVVGTGDLSEMALGWCTYGVGDQMSHYAVNTGVPKTLIQHLIRWTISTDQFDAETDAVLGDILGTEISPELVPQGEEEELQSTEAKIGPYELHDFFLYHLLRQGQAPSKVAFLAWHAWRDAARGSWPVDFPEADRRSYDLPTIVRWLEVFLERFYGFSQFKRSALPNGPKVSGGGSRSPRGDWRAPSDGTAAPFLAELRSRVPGGAR